MLLGLGLLEIKRMDFLSGANERNFCEKIILKSTIARQAPDTLKERIDSKGERVCPAPLAAQL